MEERLGIFEMLVKFASLCDIDNCGKRSGEYTTWPSCLICQLEFCPMHGIITIESDVDQPERGFCNSCAKDENENNWE